MGMARRTRGIEAGDRAVEWLCAGVMLAWSYTLSLPGDTLAAPAFAAFHRFGMNEDTWTWAFASMGGGRLVALYINGRWPKTPYIRVGCAAFGFLTWTQVAYLLHAGVVINNGPPSTGVGVYSMLALGEAFSIYRAMHDARYYTRRLG